MSEPSDDFGAFLQSVQSAASKGGETGNTSRTKLMTLLSRLGEVDMAQLVAVVEMPWTEFIDGVESLKGAGLVEVNETNQGSKIKLSDEGQRRANALGKDA